MTVPQDLGSTPDVIKEFIDQCLERPDVLLNRTRWVGDTIDLARPLSVGDALDLYEFGCRPSAVRFTSIRIGVQGLGSVVEADGSGDISFASPKGIEEILASPVFTAGLFGTPLIATWRCWNRTPALRDLMEFQKCAVFTNEIEVFAQNERYVNRLRALAESIAAGTYRPHGSIYARALAGGYEKTDGEE